jgi:hypothetical protein
MAAPDQKSSFSVRKDRHEEKHKTSLPERESMGQISGDIPKGVL